MKNSFYKYFNANEIKNYKSNTHCEQIPNVLKPKKWDGRF